MNRFTFCLAISCMTIGFAGCQSSDKIEAMDVRATVRATDGLQPLKQYPLTIRTFETTKDGKRKEVKGLACTLTSAQLQATATTPQRVTIPAFAAGKRFRDGGRPAPITVSCRGGGVSGHKTQEAYQPGARGGSSTTFHYSSGRTHTTNIVGMDLGLSSSFPWVFAKFDVLVE